MRTKKEVKAEIKRVISNAVNVLDRGPATVDVNAPLALFQLSAITALNYLYWVIDEKRPKFTCDDRQKTNY
jgi:hypothetical protein